jgi:hypothetical protein
MVYDPEAELVLNESINLASIKGAIRELCFDCELCLMDNPGIGLIMPDVRLHQSETFNWQIAVEILFLVEQPGELGTQLGMHLSPVSAGMVFFQQVVHPCASLERLGEYSGLKALYLLVQSLPRARFEKLQHGLGYNILPNALIKIKSRHLVLLGQGCKVILSAGEAEGQPYAECGEL